MKAPYTERYVRCCERTAVSHRLLLDYRKSGSGSWVRIADVRVGDASSYQDKTAKGGSTYTYTVSAYTLAGDMEGPRDETGKEIVVPMPVLATGVSLNKTSLTMNIGDKVTLTATVAPSNTTDKSVTWKSSNTAGNERNRAS